MMHAPARRGAALVVVINSMRKLLLARAGWPQSLVRRRLLRRKRIELGILAFRYYLSLQGL